VTNALQYLPAFDFVYVLKDGRVAQCGTFATLSHEAGGVFSYLMQANADTLKVLGDKPHPSNLLAAPADGPTDVPNESFGPKGGAPPPTQEEREVGSVTRAVYWSWIRAGGGVVIAILSASVYALSQCTDIATRWWLTYWSENGEAHPPGWYLGFYACLNAASCLLYFIMNYNTMRRGLAASSRLYRQLLATVLRAPMSFFDTTPLGRVTNRFSKDIYTLDENLPNTVHLYLTTLSTVIGTLIVVCVVTPFFAIALIPIILFYVHSQRYFLKTSRELKRIESVSRSPIYALFSETLDGLASVRAFHAEERFMLRNKDLLDRNQRAYFLTFAGNCWLAIRLEFAGTMIVTFAALFAVLGRGASVDFAAVAGLSVSFALSVTQALNWSVRMASQLESEMVSVERIRQYVDHLEPEAPTHVPDADPPPGWPTSGEVVFRDVQLRYRPDLPLVLKGLSLTLRAREKVGVVGRTGAGKSSLIVSLLRLVELEAGTILIDGIDIRAIGLQPLRSGLAVIPQDPLLFSGTIRSNLDPFGVHADALLWGTVERVGLSRTVTGLLDVVEEGGHNFSAGQRQLLCVARALLARSRVVLMDEATAAIDVETDAMLQRVLREEFADATTITIAHRLNTVLESDRVLVMDDGRAAEFDTPSALLARPGSLFHQLVHNWEASHS